MKQNSNISPATSKGSTASKQRSYNEVIDYLDSRWSTKAAPDLASMKQLDQALGSVLQKTPTILISGTNGKSLTAHFVTKLLKEEGLTVGTLYSPHILTYNERITLKNEAIANKAFTDIANEIINLAETNNINATAQEILTAMAFAYFKNNDVDVVVAEVTFSTEAQPLSLCTPTAVAVTRLTLNNKETASDETMKVALNVIKKGTHVVSGDQSKLNLQTMQTCVEKMGGKWAMPIRKLAPLAYPFEQLHGRCAALAERVAQLFIEDVVDKNSIVIADSLLIKQKGQRGRPTLEAKRRLELNPKRTIEQFWKETCSTLPGRFQLLEKEKPMVLLDNASNLDALSNLLLGTRLLHYQRSLKGLTLLIGCNDKNLDIPEFLKVLRYFLKKTSGQVVICPIESMAGDLRTTSWEAEKITNELKSLKIRATFAKNFQEAFEHAASTVDDRNGLVVITGSPAIINSYWQYKGIKRVQ